MKKCIAISLCLLLCLAAIACGGIKEAEIKGHTWGGSWEQDGITYTREMTFAADGTFSGTFTLNGEETPISGTWKLEKGKLIVKDTGGIGYMEFEYMGGKLKNGNDIALEKKN